jgi:hypothetical protein
MVNISALTFNEMTSVVVRNVNEYEYTPLSMDIQEHGVMFDY